MGVALCPQGLRLARFHRRVRAPQGLHRVLEPYSLSHTSIETASPRWLSDVAGYGGPLLTWLPLLVASRPIAGTRPLLCTALIWYLSLIGVVRHTHLLLPSRWDPSGHCFVYGAQLLPLWAISSLPALADWRVPRVLTLWSLVLLYLSAAPRFANAENNDAALDARSQCRV